MITCKEMFCFFLFEDFKSGFRVRHSTEMEIVNVTNDLLTASDSGLISVIVWLYLRCSV